jgi:excisionase family DNA binding protein
MTAQLVTAQDVARILGVSPRGAYRLAERREVPTYRVGRLIRFDLEEVLAALRQEPEEVR